jgi:tight adherence protein C
MPPIDLYQVLLSLMLGGSIFALIHGLFRKPVVAQVSVQRQVARALGADRALTIFEQPIVGRLMLMALALARRLRAAGIRQRIGNDLAASGNPGGYNIDEYLALCVACAAGLGAVGLTMALLIDVTAPLVALTMTALGFFAPLATLNGAAKRRLLRIAKQLPYTLDLLALMLGAGGTFAESIDTIIRDNPDDDFNQELRIVQAEIDFGSSRALALRNLAQRLPLDALRSVVGAINQAEALGTPLSTILKTQADMIRSARSTRAEKLSASASLRILVPSMLIMIAVVITLFGPMLVRYFATGQLY